MQLRWHLSSDGQEDGHQAKKVLAVSTKCLFSFLLYNFDVVYEDKWIDGIYHVNSKRQKNHTRSTLWHFHFLGI